MDLGLLNRVDPLSDYYLDVLAHNVVSLATAVNTCECSASKIWYKNYKNDIILLCFIHYFYVQNGYTALMYAALNGHTATVQYLVERTTAQVNATNNVSHSNSVQCITVHVHWVLVNKHKYH